ncbi:MAG: SDR family oxidoreductase [Treponema sp.]|nr:SDR family oxidoreductase [Treponema sp.]
MMNNKKKTAFITGASRGIGKAIKEVFGRNGYKTVCPTRSELELSSQKSVADYCKKHKDDVFDVIVNCAGINDINQIENVSDEEMNRMIQVDLLSPIMLLRAFVPAMKRQKYGRIVNIGSIWAQVSKPGRGMYSAAKNGIHGITNALALECAESNVLVNTVCPGFTLTELTKKNNTPDEIKRISADIPAKRMAEPCEIAEAVYFLASEKNTYLTGQKILVDGGYTIK